MRDLKIIQIILKNDIGNCILHWKDAKSSLYSMNNNVKLVTFRIVTIKLRNFD